MHDVIVSYVMYYIIMGLGMAFVPPTLVTVMTPFWVCHLVVCGLCGGNRFGRGITEGVWTHTLSPQVMKPMVKIAREVIQENGYDTVISVVGKRSTETSAGEGRQQLGM